MEKQGKLNTQKVQNFSIAESKSAEMLNKKYKILLLKVVNSLMSIQINR
jgi:hypothetical protein